MGDDDERAVVRAQRLLELLDGFEVEVVRGLVEHEEVHLARLELGQVRPRPLARRQRRPGAPDVVGAEPELGEQGPRIDRGEAGRQSTNASSERRSPCSTRSCPIVPITVVRPSSLTPCSSGKVAEEHRRAASTCRCRCAR